MAQPEPKTTINTPLRSEETAGDLQFSLEPREPDRPRPATLANLQQDGKDQRDPRFLMRAFIPREELSLEVGETVQLELLTIDLLPDIHQFHDDVQEWAENHLREYTPSELCKIFELDPSKNWQVLAVCRIEGRWSGYESPEYDEELLVESARAVEVPDTFWNAPGRRQELPTTDRPGFDSFSRASLDELSLIRGGDIVAEFYGADALPCLETARERAAADADAHALLDRVVACLNAMKDRDPLELVRERNEFLEMLDNVSATLETMLVAFGGRLSDECESQRKKICQEARDRCDALLRPNADADEE